MNNYFGAFLAMHLMNSITTKNQIYSNSPGVSIDIYTHHFTNSADTYDPINILSEDEYKEYIGKSKKEIIKLNKKMRKEARKVMKQHNIK